MAKSTKIGGKSVFSWFLDDWFYAILLILAGVVLLGVNLGLVSTIWITYWPVVLIVIGIKELLEQG